MEDIYYSLRYSDVDILAIDTETTGLGHDDRIVEIALVQLDADGQVVDSFETLVNPGREISEEASSVSGITNADVEGAPTFAEIRREVCDFLDRGAVWVAHNAQFDMRMLSYDLEPRHWPRGIPTLCTKLASRRWGHRKNSLAHISRALNIPQTNAHRAFDDAKVCGLVARHFVRDMPVVDFMTRWSHEWIK